MKPYHCDVVAVEQDLVQLCDPPPLGRGLILGYVLQVHVDKVVKAEERPHQLLVVLHDDVDSGADGLVHELQGEQAGGIGATGVGGHSRESVKEKWV